MKTSKPIKGGVLLRRAFMVVMVSLLLTVGLMMLLYIVLSRSMFTSVKYAELTPKARAMAALAADFIDSRSDTPLRGVMEQLDPALVGAYFAVVDERGELLLASSSINIDDV